MRKRVRDIGEMLLDQPADGKLMLGVDDRPEEADRDRLHLQRRQPPEDGDRGRLVERRLDRPVRHDALGTSKVSAFGM